jgi:MFS family permease
MLAMNLANCLIIGTAATLLFLGRLQVWQVYIFALLSSTATLVHRPSLQSSIPNLVAEDQLTKANSLYQIANGASGIIGPALGGMLVGLIGSGPTMWVDAITFCLAGFSLFLSAFSSPRAVSGKGWGSVFSDTLFGFKFLYHKKSLFFMLLLFALINFLLAPTAVLFSALSAGMLLGGLLTTRLKRFRRYGLGVIWGLALLGVALAVFGLSRELVLSLGALAVLGLAVAIVNIFEAVIFQTHVPNKLQGRVFAAQSAITDGLQPISLAAIGGLLTLLAAPVVLVGSGLLRSTATR